MDPLNAIWAFLFLSAFVVAVFRLFSGQLDVFDILMKSTFDLSKVAFEISLGLTGVLTLWMGLMRIGERAGFVQWLTRLFKPLFYRLMPNIPANHPALGSILMNMAANILGLDNAATPAGLKAMRELQTLNSNKDTATNEQILFLVINTSSVTVFPVTIFAFRAQQGAASPTDVFIPILLATFFSTFVGLLSVAFVQRINILDRVVFSYLIGFLMLIGGIVFYFSKLDAQEMQRQSSLISNFLLFSTIITFLSVALFKRVNVYETFIEGAKEGFQVAVMIIPYLVAMLVAIGVFRASGAMDWILSAVRGLVSIIGLDTAFVDALPTAFMKPLSGSGARGLMVEAMQTYGADSFVGRLASVFQGSTETTFYVLAVYFGSVGIRKTRYAAPCGLLADAAGAVAAIFVAYMFFR